MNSQLKRSKRILIIGSGDIARRAMPWLAARMRVYALVHHATESEKLRQLGATPIVGDLDQPHTLRRLAGLADAVLYTAPPPASGQSDPRLRHALAALSGRGGSLPPRQWVYISTSGVYGDCHGAWVDETRPPAPTTARGQRRVAAEKLLRRYAQRQQCSVAILRAPGIYAADRLPLARIERQDPVLNAAEDVYTNHIHAEDLAKLCCIALFRGQAGRVYHASDDNQLKMGDYFDAVADHFGYPRPPRLTRAAAAEQLSPLTLSFMSESRRLKNQRIKKELRVQLRYPQLCFESPENGG